MADFRCEGVHDGPFFFERENVQRCDACRQLVTADQVRAAARQVQAGRDGNEAQLEQSAPRACELANSRMEPFRS